MRTPSHPSFDSSAPPGALVPLADGAAARAFVRGERFYESPAFRESFSAQGLVVPRLLRWPYQSLYGDSGLMHAVNSAHRMSPGCASEEWHQKVAALLNDRVGSTRDLVPERWIPALLIRRFEHRRQGPLRHCVECLKVAYHSPIHLLPWITHCPLHLEQALRLCCETCARSFTGAFSRVCEPCPRCGTVATDPLAVAGRERPPLEGFRRIERYIQFVEAASTLRHAELPFLAREHPLPLQRPRDIREVDRDDDVAIAVAALAERLGFGELRHTILRAPMPELHWRRAAHPTDWSYLSSFADGDTNLWDPRRPSDLEEGIESSFSGPDREAALNRYRQARESLPKPRTTAVAEAFEEVYAEALRAVTPDRELLCTRGLQLVTSRKHRLDNCVFCGSLADWCSAVLDRKDGPWPMEEDPGQWDHVRKTDSLSSVELDEIRLTLFKLDTRELFLKDLQRQFERHRIPLSYEPELRRREGILFSRFLLFETPSHIELVYWNPTDLVQEFRKVRRHFSCWHDCGPKQGCPASACNTSSET